MVEDRFTDHGEKVSYTKEQREIVHGQHSRSSEYQLQRHKK